MNSIMNMMGMLCLPKNTNRVSNPNHQHQIAQNHYVRAKLPEYQEIFSHSKAKLLEHEGLPREKSYLALLDYVKSRGNRARILKRIKKGNREIEKFLLKFSWHLDKDNIKSLRSDLKKFPSLQTIQLIINHNPDVPDHEMIKLYSILKDFLSLKALKIELLNTIVPKTLIEALMKNIMMLTSFHTIDLKLFECDKINDEWMGNFCKNLKHFYFLKNLKLCLVDVYDSQVTNKSMEYLKRALFSIKSLKTLIISLKNCNRITDQGTKLFCQGISHHTELETLNIDFPGLDKFSQESAEILGKHLKNLTMLQSLRLNWTDIEIASSAIELLSENLKHRVLLQSLKLCFTNCKIITDDGMASLGECLKHLTSLERISLSFAECPEITENGIKCLFQSLSDRNSLEDLELLFSTCVNITNKGIQPFSNFLKTLIPLQRLKLDFAKNHAMIDDERLQLLANGMGSLASLQDLCLNFSNCSQITDKGLKCLALVLAQLISLKHINLDFNKCYILSDAGLRYICDALPKLSSLEHIYLNFSEDTKITNQGVVATGKSIAKHFSCYGSLKTVRLVFRYCEEINDVGKDSLHKVLKAVAFALRENLMIDCHTHLDSDIVYFS